LQITYYKRKVIRTQGSAKKNPLDWRFENAGKLVCGAGGINKIDPDGASNKPPFLRFSNADG
jgi:hypothetical protein